MFFGNEAPQLVQPAAPAAGQPQVQGQVQTPPDGTVSAAEAAAFLSNASPSALEFAALERMYGGEAASTGGGGSGASVAAPGATVAPATTPPATPAIEQMFGKMADVVAQLAESQARMQETMAALATRPAGEPAKPAGPPEPDPLELFTPEARGPMEKLIAARTKGQQTEVKALTEKVDRILNYLHGQNEEVAATRAASTREARLAEAADGLPRSLLPYIKSVSLRPEARNWTPKQVVDQAKREQFAIIQESTELSRQQAEEQARANPGQLSVGGQVVRKPKTFEEMAELINALEDARSRGIQLTRS